MSAVATILDALTGQGVRCLFGIPDPAFLDLLAQAHDRGLSIIAPHHEAAGGFMAEAAARVTGTPGVLMLSPGPGVANALPAMACARAERARVLYLGGARGELRDPTLAGRFQYADQLALVAGAVDWAGRLGADGAALGQAMAQTGAAYLDCPFPVMLDDMAPVAAPVVEAAPDLAPIAAQLAQAQAPIMLVGHGLTTAQRHATAVLARALACPVVLTPGGAALPGLGAQCVPYGFSPVAGRAIEQADCVLSLGSAVGEAVHFGQRRHWRKGRTDRAWIRFTGDAGALARMVFPQSAHDLSALAHAEAARRAAWEAQARAHPPSPIHPARLVVEAMAACPPDALLVRDGGASVLWQLAHGAMHEGGVLWSRAFAHLGTGLPYAIGALVAERAMDAPPRRAMVLTGDSAALFHIAELEVAVRLCLPIVMVVAVDHQWGLEAAAYRQRHGEGAMRPGVDWGAATRFDRISQGFGARGLFVDQAGDLSAALTQAFAERGPTVIHAAIDAQANGVDLPGWAELASWYSDGMAP